jgi:hypothetical protein
LFPDDGTHLFSLWLLLSPIRFISTAIYPHFSAGGNLAARSDRQQEL